jgi:hypothetical protein
MSVLGINNSVVHGTAIPNYSNALKEQSAMIFIPNRYTRLYYSIISNAKQRALPRDTYKEEHHIIPESLGGSNDLDNLVSLTYREHRICHKLLVRMTTGADKGKMAYALLFFKVSESTKKTLIKSISDYRKNFMPITDGISDKWILKTETVPEGFTRGFSPATIKKHGDGNKGKKWITNGVESKQIKSDRLPEGWYYGQTEKHKENNSNALSGMNNPMYGKFGSSHPAYGYKHPDKDLLLLSVSKQGSKNPMFGKIPANAKTVVIDGITYASMKEAGLKTGLSRRQLENITKEKYHEL